MGITVTERESFDAIGVRWEGTFKQAQAGEIRTFMQQFRERLEELPDGTDTSSVFGISYDVSAEGFTYYLCCKVLDSVGELPDGMERITVPSLTYATYKHSEEENVSDSYTKVYEWIKENGYNVDEKASLEHLEIYPADYQPINERPRLIINIPIK